MDASLQALAPSHLSSRERTRLGAWYTPPEMVEILIANALEPALAHFAPGDQLVIVDPACGTGNILRAAAATLETHGWSAQQAQVCLVGIDVDPDALRICSDHLPGATLIEADGLTYRLQANVVMGNPPFLSQLRRRTARATASHRYVDSATIFLSRWCEQLKSGGRLAMVQPLSMLATSDSEAIRHSVLRHVTVECVIAQTRSMFDASVHTAIVVLDASGPDTTDLASRPTWSHLVADQFGVTSPSLTHNLPTLGSIAHATADFRDQFYGLVGAVGDGVDGPPLITSGLIDVGRVRWAERPVTFAKRRYAAPRVALGLLSPSMREWAQRRLVPKVLVATQAKRLHAAADPSGAWLPSVPVITVTPNDARDLERIEAAILHPSATDWARATYLGTGLHPLAIKLSARQLLRMPLFNG